MINQATQQILAKISYPPKSGIKNFKPQQIITLDMVVYKFAFTNRFTVTDSDFLGFYVMQWSETRFY